MDGRINRLFGWLLLLVVFAFSAWFDPWALQQRPTLSESFQQAQLARHAQAVALGMAFFQILVGRLLAHRPRPLASALLLAGTVFYIAGYAGYVFAPDWAYLAVVGACVNGVGLLLLYRRYPESLGPVSLVALVILTCGMLLDAAMALHATEVGLPAPTWASDPNSVQMRMLRLARAAMIALPLLALNCAEACQKAPPVHRYVEWACFAGIVGAATMSPLLVLSCVWLPFKYLLAIPANAAVIGVVAGAYFAWRGGHRLELIGWVLVLVSMEAGLLMGLYAFEGPVPDPEFIGGYIDLPRRMTRLGHAYVIVVGLMLINLRHDLPESAPKGPGILIAAGGVWIAVTVLMLVTRVRVELPIVHPLAGGPLFVAFGLAYSLRWLIAGLRRDGAAAKVPPR